jgi:hypothetical protein
MRRVHYGIDTDTGLVVSQVYGEGYAVPVLDFEGMKPENKFEMKYNLEKFETLCYQGAYIRWTRKIPTAIKNRHRKFWNMKELTHA